MAEAIDDGQTGFLVEPGDVAGLARLIIRFFREGRATGFGVTSKLRDDLDGRQ